ncbi:uncharacterized protein CTRU02_213559 [Colletotrichum truncatum]|uniref:Uncharacterized protein n=1 Tax=Colletotrichum truncatum TaxID=5467 RepID=A0ACC3YG53_COLTU
MRNDSVIARQLWMTHPIKRLMLSLCGFWLRIHGGEEDFVQE